MPIEQTLAIIKPEIVKANMIGQVLAAIEKSNLKIVAAKMTHMGKVQASEFYDIHKGKPFFNNLVDFMSSGPVLVMVLEGDNAISYYREVMGATNPEEASPHSLRADFAESIDHNAVHGSDAPETAEREIAFFFEPEEIFSR